MSWLAYFLLPPPPLYTHRKPTNKPTFDFVHSTCRRHRTRTVVALYYIFFIIIIVSVDRSPSHSAYFVPLYDGRRLYSIHFLDVFLAFKSYFILFHVRFNRISCRYSVCTPCTLNVGLYIFYIKLYVCATAPPSPAVIKHSFSSKSIHFCNWHFTLDSEWSDECIEFICRNNVRLEYFFLIGKWI